METKHDEEKEILNNRMQNILTSLAKCKIDFINEREECKKIREINAKLETELKEARELEKSHRYHLLTSREMIGNLQDTVSQLVYLKRDVKKLKDDITSKDLSIAAIEREKESIMQKHNESIKEIREANDKFIQELTLIHERKMEQLQHSSDTQIAQFTCVIEELRSKIREMETEQRDKMNVVVLEYEEKIQRGAAHISQLQEQLTRQASRTDANIDAYRRRLEELEEKLKQSEFKQYLAHTYPSQFENHVERPYSVDRDSYPDINTSINPVMEPSSSKQMTQNKAQKNMNTLQVQYYGKQTPSNTPRENEKKGQFNITKKRKLYNEKEFQDF